jgi:hypothetical protein
MDPIHPIVPVVPDILPILPTTKAGRIERETRRQAPEQRSRKRPPRGAGAGGEATRDVGESGAAPYGELPPGDEDDGLGHVDLTA